MSGLRASQAQIVTLARGGRWHGGYGTLPRPVCQPEARPGQNALTLSDGAKGLLAHCKKAGCEFPSVAAALGIRPGTFAVLEPAVIAKRNADQRANAEKRAQQARAIWDAAKPICGSIAETYLRMRGITCALPDSLRFYPECWHGPTALRLPALVARVDGSDGFALHRTFLRPDGSGKADVPKGTCKMMLGACAGGAVRLASGAGRLVVAEGIETALSLCCGLLDGPATVWAALSAPGMRALVLPERAGRLTVACDGDVAGRAAGMTLSKRANGLGWRVGIMDPGDGRDFNDVLSEEVTTQ